MNELSCPNCSTKLLAYEDQPVLVCQGCGKKYKNPYFVATENLPATVAPPTANNGANANAPARNKNKGAANNISKSEFTGGLFGLIGNNIVNAIIVVITFGLGIPWVICRSHKWYVEHQVLDGYKLTFDGHAGQLFGNWIKWIFLSFLTVGIYALWIPIKKEKWVTSHTHIIF